jgi:hypothetical protein
MKKATNNSIFGFENMDDWCVGDNKTSDTYLLSVILG